MTENTESLVLEILKHIQVNQNTLRTEIAALHAALYAEFNRLTGRLGFVEQAPVNLTTWGRFGSRHADRPCRESPGETGH